MVGLGATLIVPAAAEARDPDAGPAPSTSATTDYHSLYHEQMDQANKAAPAPKPAARPKPTAAPKPAPAPKPAATRKPKPEPAAPTTDYHSRYHEQMDQANKAKPAPKPKPKRVTAPKPAKPEPAPAPSNTDYHSRYHEQMDQAAKTQPAPKPAPKPAAKPAPKPAVTPPPKPAAVTPQPTSAPTPAATSQPPAAAPSPAAPSTDYHSLYHERMDRANKATPAPKPATTPKQTTAPTAPAATPQPAATPAASTPTTDYHSLYHERMDRANKAAPTPKATTTSKRTSTPKPPATTPAPVTDYHTLYHQRMDQAMRNAPFDARQLLDPSGNVIQIGNAPNIAPPAGTLLPFPGGEGQRVSVGTTCGTTSDAGGGSSAKCSGLPPRYEGTHRPKARAGITRETTITGTEGRTANVMTPEGEKASLQVTAEVLVKLGGEAKLKALDVSYKKVAKGHKIVYQITASPGRIAQISNDPKVAPKANDPRTIRPGETVVINEENFTGSEGSASAKNVKGEYSRSEGDRQSAGVQRVNDSTVRITVGDEKFVRQVARLGVGTDFAALGAYGVTDDAKGDLRQVNLNIRTKQGWDDYQRFLATGRVAYRPNMDFSTVKRATHDGTTGLYGKLGPAEFSTTGIHQGSDQRIVRNSDGTANVVGTMNVEGNTLSYDQKTERNGKAGALKLSLLVRNVTPQAIKEYAAKSGDAPKTDGAHDDVKIDFTDGELTELQNLAITRIQRVRGELHMDKLSRQDIIDGKASDTPGVSDDSNIASAKTPAQRLYYLYTGSWMKKDALQHLTDPGGQSTCGAPGHITVLPD